MALRLKSEWFRDGVERTPAQSASVLAATQWRLAQAMVPNLRRAGFDIEVGPPVFGLMREVLLFMAHLVDRMAYARMDAAQRSAFTTSMVQRLAALVEDSEREWLGEPPPGQERWAHQFIEQFNRTGEAYADFGLQDDQPDFGFVRLLGYRVEALMQPQDRHWITDQLMAIEIPQTIAPLRRALDGALHTGVRERRRTRLQGD